MMYLFLSVLFNSSLFVILKYFERFQVNSFQAIVVNYFVAFTVGFLLKDESIQFVEVTTKPWFYWIILLGSLFIIIFNVTALTAQKGGLSVVSVAGKMSVVIPVVFGILVYNESMSFLKFIGIVLALIAVYLTAYKKGTVTINSNLMFLVLLLFVGSGIIDTMIKYIETNFVAKNEIEFFIASTFLMAGIIGILILFYQLIQKQTSFSFKSIIGGLVLGIPNYFSLYFLVKALQHPTLESSTLFTINNVLIVTLTSLLGIVLFKEYLSPRNKIGILLAIAAIVMFYI